MSNDSVFPGVCWQIAALQRPVSDLAHSTAFYVQALGFEEEPSVLPGHAIVRLGCEQIILVALDASRFSAAMVAGPDVRFQHAAIVAADMAAAYQRLMHFSPDLITLGAPQRLPAAAGGVTAFKFRDPDGHPLELIAFPTGTGNARWHTGSQPNRQTCPTLGIDHFALSVSDIARSIAFYANTFGYTVASRQINSGPEQAMLDGLDVSIVEVVALAPGSPDTPHIELLAYRQPSVQVHEGTFADEEKDCLLLAVTGVKAVAKAVAKASTASFDQSSDKALVTYRDIYKDPDGHILKRNKDKAKSTMMGEGGLA